MGHWTYILMQIPSLRPDAPQKLHIATVYVPNPSSSSPGLTTTICQQQILLSLAKRNQTPECALYDDLQKQITLWEK